MNNSIQETTSTNTLICKENVTLTSNLFSCIHPSYTFEQPSPLGGTLVFTITVHEFGLADYALSEERLQVIDEDDVDTCIYDITGIKFISDDGVTTDMTNNTDIKSMIENQCWLMIVGRVLPDYLMMLECNTDSDTVGD